MNKLTERQQKDRKATIARIKIINDFFGDKDFYKNYIGAKYGYKNSDDFLKINLENHNKTLQGRHIKDYYFNILSAWILRILFYFV